jgi:hypothetical protein
MLESLTVRTVSTLTYVVARLMDSFSGMRPGPEVLTA